MKSEISLNDPIGIDKEGNEITLIDILGSKTDSVSDQVFLKIQIEKLYHVISKVLSKREKVVIELRYGINTEHSLTQREIAQKLSISPLVCIKDRKESIRKAIKGTREKEID